jgi:DNA-binding phage protein
MANRIYRKLTPDEQVRSQLAREAFEQDKDAIIEQGRRVFERHQRLREAVAALKAEREAQGVSLSDLEDRTGISKSSLSRLENDPTANPTITTLMRIAEALGREITITLSKPRDAA